MSSDNPISRIETKGIQTTSVFIAANSTAENKITVTSTSAGGSSAPARFLMGNQRRLAADSTCGIELPPALINKISASNGVVTAVGMT